MNEPKTFSTNGHSRTDLPDEPALLKSYMDLTGANEAQARSVYMYVCEKQVDETDDNSKPASQLN